MATINTHDLIVDFGKHKGERWTRVPIGYLTWMVNENHSRADIARAELERRGTVLDHDLVLSGHAIDRASLNCRKIWHETAKDENEGLYSWLYRMATEALEGAELSPGTEIERVHNGLKLAFAVGEIYPELKTVMPAKKRQVQDVGD
jgi:hypothetical protein